jgi:flagellar hook assembly protein FlgD
MIRAGVRIALPVALQLMFGPLAAKQAFATDVCGDINANTTWTTAGSPYIVTCDVYVRATSGPAITLTIQAGVQVKFNQNARLIIGYGTAGELKVDGTSTSPVDFTANTGSPTAGFWHGIAFFWNSTAASYITWATVHWSGDSGSNRGSVHVESGAPTLSNVTIQDGVFAAVSVNGGTPTINSSSTLKNHPIGLYATGYTSSANLQSSTISNNTGFAISLDPEVTLGTVSSLTTTGNGTNAIELRCPGATIAHSTTWKSVGLPYVVNGPYASVAGTNPILTIAAGVTVKFNSGSQLLIGSGGQLQAVGTNASRIDFTANTPTPSPGFWGGIQFQGGSSSASKLAYVKIRYGGGNLGGGLDLVYTSPILDHVVFDSNSNSGVRPYGVAATVQKCDFINNAAGIRNDTTSNLVTASLDFWGVATGPNTPGGQTVTAGVFYEPWLMAAETAPQFFKTAVQTDRTFNPAIGVNTKVTFTTQQSGSWTAKFINGSSQVVRTFTGTGSSATVIWDGKNDSGVDQPDGTYQYQLDMPSAASTRGVAIIDRTKQLTITNVAVSQAFFSPNADGVQDTTTVSATLSFEGSSWTVNVRNSANSIVRTATGTGALLSYTWNGKNGSGATQPDGLYTFELLATVGSANASATATTTLDNTLPVATITTPASGATLSNVYQSGVTDVDVVGTASDTNISTWQVDDGPTVLGTGTSSITAARLATWATVASANGSYTLRLQVWDKAGNYKSTSIPVTVANFIVSQNVLEFNGAGGSTVIYTSVLPFTLTETLFIKNEAGQTVRTLVNASLRNAGSFNDTWDGKNGSAALLPNGAYFYVATVTDGTHSITWDLSAQYLNDWFGTGEVSGRNFDPFNNAPLSITTSFGVPGRTTIAIKMLPGLPPDNCNPPYICPKNGKYEESGSHTLYWAGVDSAGKYNPQPPNGLMSLAAASSRALFPKNAVVLFGTACSVTGVTVTPPVFGPATGTQTVAFTLSTYQNQAAVVTVSFLNQDSLSILRTINLGSQSVGGGTAVWDGKADNGVLVAPGAYLVTVTASDSIGNIATGQIMTTVQY